MVQKEDFERLRLELSVKAKNGLDFIIAACIVWSLIAYVWTLSYTPYSKSVLTFIIGGPMLPLALILSKVLKTTWKVRDNPLQPLGLWLNFAQLFYFPILVFVLIKSPEYFVLCYVIITGAHFFPYAWYYNVKAFAIMAGVIAVGSILIALKVEAQDTYLIPVFMVVSLAILAVWLLLAYRSNKLKYERIIS
ncbi:MAG: hypothetical protein JNM57_01525 [Cyclobacteriaceae bacterium]|nr:hypothetical protein [Cyclobacteriaceae bacterium]